MRIRIAGIEILDVTLADLDEIIKRYGQIVPLSEPLTCANLNIRKEEVGIADLDPEDLDPEAPDAIALDKQAVADVAAPISAATSAPSEALIDLTMEPFWPEAKVILDRWINGNTTEAVNQLHDLLLPTMPGVANMLDFKAMRGPQEAGTLAQHISLIRDAALCNVGVDRNGREGAPNDKQKAKTKARLTQLFGQF